MSTDSVNQFSMEDDGSVMETPPQSMQKCLRGSPCSRPDCPKCTGPANNSHVRDFTDNLEVSLIKPTIPLNHWIIDIINSFKDAIQDQDIAELAMLTERYQQKIRTLSDLEIKHDRTEIKQLNRDATQLLANLSKPTAPADHWIPYLTGCLKEYIQKQDTVQLDCLTDMYSKLKTKQWTIGTDYHEYN